MATMRDVVADARRMAYGPIPDSLNILASQYDQGDTEVVLAMDVAGVTPGSIVSCGLNTWIVRAVDSSVNTLTVLQFDSSPSTTMPVDSIVYVSPRFTDWYCFTQAVDVIRSLSSPWNGLYKVSSWTADVEPTWQTYTIPDAAAGLTDILMLRVREPGSVDTWSTVPGTLWSWLPEQGSVQVKVDVWAGTDIEFIYKAPFTLPTSLDDDLLADVGLPETAHDIPALGVLARHFRSTEGRRLQVKAQGDPRRAEEVAAMTNMSLARQYSADLKSRVDEERTRLNMRYPKSR